MDRSRTELDDDRRDEIYKQMQIRMETVIRQVYYPIQKFDYSIYSERVRDLYDSPIYQGKRLADVWLSDS
ncbi:hypothetical protein [Nonomuraea sp. KM88]|uniref:hypothetical protein n=1 Tax=Nonomuraea sp. KM88 TaxID=3457427 RepID=UPI003FCEC759